MYAHKLGLLAAVTSLSLLSSFVDGRLSFASNGTTALPGLSAAERTWGPTITLTAARQPAHSLDFAVGLDGTTAATWRQERSVVVATRPAHGSWGEPVVLGRAHTWSQGPHVAVDGRGLVTVLWSSASNPGECGSRSDQVVARSRSAGGRWGPTVTLNRLPPHSCDYISDQQLTVNKRGDTIVVWRWEADDWSGAGHTAAAYRRAGERWGAPQVLRHVGFEQGYKQVVLLDKQGNATLYFDRYEAMGVARRTVERGWLKPRVFMRLPGGFDFVAGSSPRGDQVVVAQTETSIWARSRPVGGHWSMKTWIGNGHSPTLAVDARGRATVSFASATAGGAASVVQGTRRGVWSLPKVVSPSGARVTSIAVAANNSGDRVLTWVRNPKGERGPSLWTCYSPAGQGWWTPERITGRTTLRLGSTHSAVFGTGQAAVAWISRRSDDPGSPMGVRVRRMTTG